MSLLYYRIIAMLIVKMGNNFLLVQNWLIYCLVLSPREQKIIQKCSKIIKIAFVFRCCPLSQDKLIADLKFGKFQQNIIFLI